MQHAAGILDGAVLERRGTGVVGLVGSGDLLAVPHGVRDVLRADFGDKLAQQGVHRVGLARLRHGFEARFVRDIAKAQEEILGADALQVLKHGVGGQQRLRGVGLELGGDMVVDHPNRDADDRDDDGHNRRQHFGLKTPAGWKPGRLHRLRIPGFLPS